MRVLIQRVSKAAVWVDQQEIASIGKGLLLFLGIEHRDTQEDVAWLIKKIGQLRIFNDSEGNMNRSIQETGGSFLLVSQFTLHAKTKKGNRPSFIQAAKPEQAIPLYELFAEQLSTTTSLPVATGVFGAHMEVVIHNDGPVTIWIDTHQKE